MFKNLKNEVGIALFLVLWVLTLLSVIVGEFCHAMRTEVNITRNFKEMTQSYYIAAAGLNQAISQLIANPRKPFKATPENGEADEKIPWRVNAEIPAIAFAQGQFEVRIDNESGKVNVNNAGHELLTLMLNGFELDDTDKNIIVDSISDWRDKDDLHRINGAENDYYLSLPDPYHCKNSDFDSVGELLLVRGISPEIFYGGLKDRVTVYQDETVKKKVQSRININAASSSLLRALPGMTDELVQNLMEYRKEADITSLADLIEILGSETYTAIYRFITLESCAYFTIKSMGSMKESTIKQGIQALVKINTREEKKYKILQWVDRIE
ncbi:MAG: general secretion pathway protein K [Desulfobacteraceae bacterium Eth-SRB2]|nr:MAG: general secretion pathway protein K [Desulfobacteraceae bacterium Eth-SRB2]